VYFIKTEARYYILIFKFILKVEFFVEFTNADKDLLNLKSFNGPLITKLGHHCMICPLCFNEPLNFLKCLCNLKLVLYLSHII